MRRNGDLTSEGNIQFAQSMNFVRGESYRNERIPKINIGMMIGRARERSDDINKFNASVKRTSHKLRARNVRRDAPLLHPWRTVKLLGRKRYCHLPNLRPSLRGWCRRPEALHQLTGLEVLRYGFKPQMRRAS